MNKELPSGLISVLKKCSILFFMVCSLRATAQVDACASVGWANYNNTSFAGAPTGGSSAPITVSTMTALVAAAKVSGNVIYVSGTMGSGYSNSAEIVAGQGRVNLASNVTIIGLAGATVKAFFNVKNVNNVIIRNLIIQGPGAQDIDSWDDITVDNSTNIWVDHCDIRDGEDSNFDIKNGSNNVSVTWTIFQYTAVTLAVGANNHNFSNTIGTDDGDTQDAGKLKVTFQYCWWNGAMERTPRVRFGQVHVANCLMTEAPTTTNTGGSTTGLPVSRLGISDGYNSDVRVENNNFINIDDPLDRGKESTTTPSTAVMNSINNLFTTCTGSFFTGCQGPGTCPGFTPPYTLALAANTVLNTPTFKNCVGATLTPVVGSAITCPCSSSLPVHLVSFTVQPDQNGYLLNWLAEDNTNLKNIIIESSSDGINFQENETLSKNTSSYLLPSTELTDQGAIYIKLKFVDEDGSNTYSPERTVYKKDIYKVYPNPFENHVYVTGVNQGKVVIYTIEGTKVYEGSLSESGIINLETLYKGTYFLTIIDNANNVVRRTPIIKL
jgi:pectate lyase